MKIVVCSRKKLLHNGLASMLRIDSIIQPVSNHEIINKVQKTQPDLLIYELQAADDLDYNNLQEVSQTCRWTKIVVVNFEFDNPKNLARYLTLVNGYIQGPIMPSLLVKVIELAVSAKNFVYVAPLEYILGQGK